MFRSPAGPHPDPPPPRPKDRDRTAYATMGDRLNTCSDISGRCGIPVLLWRGGEFTSPPFPDFEQLDMLGLTQPNARTVVVGGGFLGTEIALALASRGLKVSQVCGSLRVGQRLHPSAWPGSAAKPAWASGCGSRFRLAPDQATRRRVGIRGEAPEAAPLARELPEHLVLTPHPQTNPRSTLSPHRWPASCRSISSSPLTLNPTLGLR